MLIFLLVVQIITESLPISSSGHVALVQNFLKRYGYDVVLPQALLWFVHGITALLMLIIMMPYWMPLVRHPWRMSKQLLQMFTYGLCAELLTVLLYVSLQGLVVHMNLIIGFIITAVTLFSLTWCYTTRRYSPFIVWMATGAAQGIAVIPGCSRFALTYATARWLGYSGRHALLLSFTLALPLFVSASCYGAYTMFTSTNGAYTILLPEWVTIMVAAVLAYGALRLASYLMIHDRAYYFGWYLVFILLLTV